MHDPLFTIVQRLGQLSAPQEGQVLDLHTMSNQKYNTP